MFTLPWLEMSRFTRSLLSKLAIIAILAVPTLYAGLYLTANWNPTDQLGKLDAAVVDLDTGADEPDTPGSGEESAEGDGSGRLEAGRDLVDALTEGDDAGFTWVETDVNDAAEGLADGSYAATLTIPADFSERLVSSAGDDPEQAGLTLQTNDAYNFIIGQVANTILKTLNANLNSDVTAQYLDQVYIGFNDIHDNVQEAADGAAELHEGTIELEDGAVQLEDGADELKDGADELKDGTGQLSEGSRQLADGAGELSSGQDQAAESSGELADGARQVADGTSTLADGADEIADTVDEVYDRAKELGSHAAPELDRAESDFTEARDTVRDDLSTGLEDLAERYPDDPQVQELLRTAQGVGDDLDRAQGRAEDAAGTARDLEEDAKAAAKDAVDTVHEVQGKVHELDDGAQQVANGAGQLHEGLNELAAGGKELKSAADELHDGAVEVDEGAGRLKDGSAELYDGTVELHDGTVEAADGAGELAEGLADGVEQIPTYDEDDRDVRSEVVSLPVDGELDRINQVGNYGEGLAPFFISLALWIGGMITYMVLNAIPPRALATPARSRRVAWAGYVPGALLGIGQVFLLFGVVAATLGFHAAHWWLTLLFAVLIAGVFAAIHQMCIVWLGGVGRLVALVLLMIQLATAGGTYPVATAPEFLQWLSPFLPMTHAVAGLRMLIAGGPTGMLAVHVLVLLLTGALAMLATIVGCNRKRLYSITRLHPSLQLA